MLLLPLLDEPTIIKRDYAGAFDEELSLHCMMESCLDFSNETMELQLMGEKLGVIVLSMTKFHAEIMAGWEGN
jgi:hypothetical protein